MKARTLLMLCGLSLATAGVAAAEPPAAPPEAEVDGLPPNRIIAIVRQNGFDPIGRPERNGDLYELRVLDPNELAYRLVVDARTGRTVSIRSIATPGPYQTVPASTRNRSGWIFGPADEDETSNPPKSPREVPQAVAPPSPQDVTVTPRPARPAVAATPLPRPRPYVMKEPTGSTPVDTTNGAAPPTAVAPRTPTPQAASVPPSVPASQTTFPQQAAPEPRAAPQQRPAPEPQTASVPPSVPAPQATLPRQAAPESQAAPAPEVAPAPQAAPVSDAAKRNGGAWMPPVAPLD